MILHGLDGTAAHDKRGDEEIKNGFHAAKRARSLGQARADSACLSRVLGQFRIVRLDELFNQRMPRQDDSVHLAYCADSRGCVGDEHR
ncbi:MAG: hypothetical protein VYD86_02800, partial [Verrucomicrobiota bacterium]|nr:hypothetical protein [Verrucomicrobiota bacterium]